MENKKINFKTINIILFVIWGEILIFIFSLFLSNLFLYPFFKLLKFILKDEFYNIFSLNIINGIKNFTLFAFLSLLQIYFSLFSIKIIKNKIRSLIYIINSIFISSFFIVKIINLTYLKEYKLFYLTIIFTMIFSSIYTILKQK